MINYDENSGKDMRCCASLSIMLVSAGMR